MKKLNVIDKKETFLINFETFCEIHSPTRHVKHKVIDFAPSNKSIITNKLPHNK